MGHRVGDDELSARRGGLEREAREVIERNRRPEPPVGLKPDKGSPICIGDRDPSLIVERNTRDFGKRPRLSRCFLQSEKQPSVFVCDQHLVPDAERDVTASSVQGHDALNFGLLDRAIGGQPNQATERDDEDPDRRRAGEGRKLGGNCLDSSQIFSESSNGTAR